MTSTNLAAGKNVVKFHIDALGASNAISDVTPAPVGSAPQNILYLKVLYIVRVDGTLSTAYDYDSISGVYPLPANLTTFLTRIRDGGTWSTSDRLQALPSGGSHLPVPVIQYPCYVVISVNLDGQAQFDTTVSPVTTDDTRAAEYFNLRAVTDSGAPTTHIVYFNAISPSYNGGSSQPDSFNLQFLVKQPDGTLKPSSLDPAIKNTGH